MWIRRGSPKQLLQQPYDGPYEVVSRKDRTFVVHVNGRNVTVSIDRLKPAYLMTEDGTTSTSTSVTTADEQAHTSAATSREDAPAITITLPGPVDASVSRIGSKVDFRGKSSGSKSGTRYKS